MASTTEQGLTLLHGKTYDNIISTVYNTPLVRLRKLAPKDATVLVKLEFFNPMASVKDRIGRSMIESAERDGILKPGTHVIEPTSGNTGIALAFVCAAKGYELTLTMPESMSVERRALLRALGANLVLTPATEGMKGAITKAAELVGTTNNAWMPQQFENPANPQVHYETTGPEIWNDTDGKVDMIVTGVGTGGTITGVTRYFKERNPDFKAVAVEPEGSPVIKQTLKGEPVKPGPHKIQGIGAGFVPRNCDTSIVTDTIQVSNEEAFEWSRKAAQQEGIFGGISTGANIAAACKVASRPENKGKTIVTVACSFGERYLSTPLFEGLVG
ncbi:MAG: cysteine synthase A [Phycisphaerales bacterium]